MKLYKSKNKGQWVGTQRDAQKNFPRNWEEMNVPVSKQGLLEFLNHFEVGNIKQPDQTVAQVNPQQIDPEAYSWVRWAYETLRRGDKKEAEAMLLRGLEYQKEK